MASECQKLTRKEEERLQLAYSKSSRNEYLPPGCSEDVNTLNNPFPREEVPFPREEVEEFLRRNKDLDKDLDDHTTAVMFSKLPVFSKRFDRDVALEYFNFWYELQKQSVRDACDRRGLGGLNDLQRQIWGMWYHLIDIR